MNNTKNEVPEGYVLLQQHEGKPLYAACLNGGHFHGWLFKKGPEVGQWVSERKLKQWEIMQAEIADGYSPSIDSIDEHGGEECEEPIWQIHHILYYAHAKLFGSRAAALASPAEPAPIHASALTPDRIMDLATAHEGPDADPLSKVQFNEHELYDFAHAIEREVLARLSKPTAQGTASRPNADCSGEPSNCPDNEGYGCACGYGAPVTADAAVTAQSIDTPEFRVLLGSYVGSMEAQQTRSHIKNVYRALIAHINRHIAAHAPAGRDAIIEECAQRVEQRAANIGPVELIGEACHETATNVIANVAAAVRALKLPQPVSSHAAEQTEGSKHG